MNQILFVVALRSWKTLAPINQWSIFIALSCYAIVLSIKIMNFAIPVCACLKKFVFTSCTLFSPSLMAVQNLPFIENMEKRIQSACSLLDASLGHCFVNGLEHRDDTAIYNCLRAYAAIDNTTNAEEIFRTAIVVPLIQKVIPQNSLGMSGGSSGDELEADYKKINHLIEEDCKFLLEITSRGMLINLL